MIRNRRNQDTKTLKIQPLTQKQVPNVPAFAKDASQRGETRNQRSPGTGPGGKRGGVRYLRCVQQQAVGQRVQRQLSAAPSTGGAGGTTMPNFEDTDRMQSAFYGRGRCSQDWNQLSPVLVRYLNATVGIDDVVTLPP